MLKRMKYLQFFLLLLPVACNTNPDYVLSGYNEKIIVEGRIESGQHPVVYLSLNVPLSEKVDTSTILNHVIRYAKVTVSDGEKTEILTSMWDRSYYPPYVYRGTDLIGEEGKRYDLKVEYGGYTLYASTTIPSGFRIDAVECYPVDVDTLRGMVLVINMDEHEKKSFRISTKKRKDSRYIKTPALFNAELNLQGRQRFNIAPYPNKTDSSYTEGNYFVKGDTVGVKVHAIDSISTLFFRDLTVFSLAADNIFIKEVKPLRSNIGEPGFGIWYGAAVRELEVEIK